LRPLTGTRLLLSDNYTHNQECGGKRYGYHCFHWFDSFIDWLFFGKNDSRSRADWFSCGSELKLEATGDVMNVSVGDCQFASTAARS
jgi:hypothetical protein